MQGPATVANMPPKKDMKKANPIALQVWKGVDRELEGNGQIHTSVSTRAPHSSSHTHVFTGPLMRNMVGPIPSSTQDPANIGIHSFLQGGEVGSGFNEIQGMIFLTTESKKG